MAQKIKSARKICPKPSNILIRPVALENGLAYKSLRKCSSSFETEKLNEQT
jgi:hypothetical protein